MAVTLLQIAAAYNRPRSTTHQHIKQLKEQGLFKKKSPGKHFDDTEVKVLERLMNFKFRRME